MELCYRGTCYTRTVSPDIPMVETEIQGIFLGQTYQIRRPAYLPEQPARDLVYRGKSYHTESTPLPTESLRRRLALMF